MTTRFYIPLSGTATDHYVRLAELVQVLETGPKRLLLILSGSGSICPDAALSYIDVLQASGIPRAVTCLGNLFGADIALWLLSADLRDIRRNSWIYVPSRLASPEDIAVGDTLVVAPRSISSERDYQRCLDLVSEYVDLAQLLDKQLSPRDLSDLYLLDTDFLENGMDLAARQTERDVPDNLDRDTPTHS